MYNESETRELHTKLSGFERTQSLLPIEPVAKQVSLSDAGLWHGAETRAASAHGLQSEINIVSKRTDLWPFSVGASVRYLTTTSETGFGTDNALVYARANVGSTRDLIRVFESVIPRSAHTEARLWSSLTIPIDEKNRVLLGFRGEYQSTRATATMPILGGLAPEVGFQPTTTGKKVTWFDVLPGGFVEHAFGPLLAPRTTVLSLQYARYASDLPPWLAYWRSGYEAYKDFAFDDRNRNGQLDFADVAQAVLWLASDRSAFVTGAEFVADGGLTMGLSKRRLFVAPQG